MAACRSVPLGLLFTEVGVLRAARFVPILVLCCSGILPAKEWAQKMFKIVDHDFGTVARGAKAEFDFELENIYKEDVHVASVRTSCNCTIPTIINPDLKTWEKGKVRAIFDTRSYLGARSATVTVVIDKPFPAEVQLSVKGFIRSDVVFEPGAADFGDIDLGKEAERTIKVKYAGRSDWRIVDVKTPKHIDVRVEPTRRQGGRIDYQMRVGLSKTAPAGNINNQLIIVTNDAKMTKIPFNVSGRVLSSLTVRPKALSLGIVRPGDSVTKQIVVRGTVPFRIVDVQCDDKSFSFKPPAKKKPIHLIPVKFTAGTGVGIVVRKINIVTDLANKKATCVATVEVRPPPRGE